MDPDKLLMLSQEHRRSFVAGTLILCAALMALDFFIISNYTTHIAIVSTEYIRAFVSTILIALLIALLIKYFVYSGHTGPGLTQVPADKISKEFNTLLASAQRWRYKGNFGRYHRGKILPELSGRPNFHSTVCIIDPQDRKLCERHANYRTKINGIDKGSAYNAERVALEVLVTIIHCAWHVANKDTKIDLYLLSQFDPVRIDASDDAMILTVEDRRKSALRIASTHFMYEHIELQMRFAREQGRQIDLKGFPSTPSIENITESQIIDFLSNINMGDLCDNLTATTILEECKTARNPYED